MTRPIFAAGLGTSPAGPKGDPGDPGAVSTVPGPQGDDGPQGPRGLPGVNAVENDEAVATYIADPESQVASALSASTARVVRKVVPLAAIIPSPARAYPPLGRVLPAIDADTSNPSTGVDHVVRMDNTGAARWSGPVRTIEAATVPLVGGGAAPQIAANDPYGTNGGYITWEFATDAPVFTFRGNFHIGSPPTIWADEELVTPVPTAGPGGTSMSVTWPTRKMRSYRVRAFNGFRLAAIHTTNIDSVIPAPIEARPSFGWMTDSYGQGGLPYLVSDMLGVNIHLSAEGGSGYIAAGPSNPFETRIAGMDNLDLSGIVFLGGLNDPTTGFATAVTNTLQHARNAHPEARLYVLGPMSPPQAPQTSSGYTTKRAALQAAAAAVDGYFIDTLDWITGTGYTGATTGEGTSDVVIGTDGTHPQDAGQQILAVRIAYAIADTITQES